MSASRLPPPLRSYQRSTSTPVAIAQKPFLSPSAELHHAVLQQQKANMAIDLRPMTSSSALSAAPIEPKKNLMTTLASFPPLRPQQCAVHHPQASPGLASPPLRSPLVHTLPCSHPNARPSLMHISTTCCLPRASFWNLRCSCIFSSLPDEVLLFSVFSFLAPPELCAVSAVSTRWRFLSTDPMLWREVDLSNQQKVLATEGGFDKILARVGDHVNSLKLCNLKMLSTESLLRLGDVHLANNASLETLHLCSLKNVNFDILEGLLAGPSAWSLRELSLFGCVNVDDACIQLIRRSCVRLADLSVRGCLKLTDAAFADEDDLPVASPMMDMMSPAPLVEPSSLGMGFMTPSTSSVSSTSSRVPSLRSYSSSSATSASPYDPNVAGKFAYLTSLNLANCKLLTEAGLIGIFRSSPRLQKLNLHALNPTDALLDALTEACPELHTLHLSSSNPFGGNLGLTDIGIELVAERLPQLQCLNLSGSSKLTDTGVRALAARCFDLEKLNLGGCFKVTDAGVAALASSAGAQTKLTHLSLFQCTLLTDASMLLLTERLTALEHLDIHSCTKLTDATVRLLAEAHSAHEIPSTPPSQSQLASLDEEDADAPAPLTFRLPNLRSIDVGSCRNLSKPAIEALHQTRADLAITFY